MTPKTAAASAPATDRGEATRRHILDAAALAFAERGYVGASLNDIVRESGLTKGAFYFHFPSKVALALAVFRMKQEQWVGRTMARMGECPSALDRLEAMLDIGCDMYENDPSARVVGRLCTELAQQPDLAPQLRPHLTAWFDIIEETIRAAQQEGDLRTDFDARSAAETIAAAFIGVEQVSDALTGLADFRARIAGLRNLVLAALRPCE